MGILLSWLTGVGSKALGLALALAVGVFTLVGGLWWLRNDARQEERQALAAQTASSRLQAAIYRQQRVREAMITSIHAETAIQAQLDAQARINAALRDKITQQQGEAICYPQNVVSDLNK